MALAIRRMVGALPTRRSASACSVCLALAAILLAASPASAQDAAAAVPTLEEVAAKADEAALAAHNGWMLTSCALVLFMTAPGLAMFYGGLVRKKNVLSVLMQCIFLMGLMTVLWALYGYSLAFGGDNPYIGNGDYLFMDGVQRFWNEETGAPETPMADAIPRLTHMLFQGMFFIITPALICGAFAERMKFSAMTLFVVLWGTFVYCPLCHWVWGGGILAFGADGAWAGGALDFAGGTVVHISSGVSALVCAMMIGRRGGQEDLRPHNLTYTALGAAMLWVGWFGFNAGSELASDGLTSSAFATTHFSAAAGAVAWSLWEWITRGKPSLLGAASGAVAGLVCITPAAGFVQPMPALAMGAIAGVVCSIACGLKNKFGYDDALDAFGVHGVGGTLGAILTGVFATRVCWDIAEGEPLGMIERGSVMTGQIVATAVTWLFSIVATFILLKIVDALVGLRVSEQTERIGLDLDEHGEEGYLLM
ncbi:Ammonium transporter NrgA [Pseudobythopirellula maris]|uniref:Ammonium transporter n=1 Tax=Pseudobythopirellula maris TaxID=2527991 RepID=A0A5C5ZG62_9BACT|nr:ammonium transporter [Pseudobythopirellula maris]TWT86322.1 Ammonium transporter NrgA [Pseudobythopirellula maris]